MKVKALNLFVVASLGLVVGCPFVPAPGPEAVLEGTWTITPADPGEFEGFTYEARFDSNGNLVEINGTRPDGATASLDIENATTTVEGSDVTVSIPRLTGTTVFNGTLSGDQDTIEGSITDEIDLGNLEVSLPGGELTLERIVDDGDPCDGVTCDPGESCVDGLCVADDPCDGVTCDPGESCVDGLCVADDPCDGVTCDPGESCVDGVCVPQEPTGDPAAGEAYYTANNCAACHGADAMGPPSLIGVEADRILEKLDGSVSHVGGTFDGVTEQDAADLAAWLATL